MLKIGTIFSNLFRPVPPQPVDPVRLIDGGPNAPELGMRPCDYREGEITEGGGWQAQVKVDGIRCLYIDGRVVTLEGQPFNAARHCLPALRDLESTYEGCMVFDGEYVEEGGFEATQRAYQKGEGQGTLWLFDAVPLDQWRVDQCTATWKQRQAQLRLNYMAAQSPWVGTLDSFPVKDDAEALALFRTMREHHHEGIVLKKANSLYRRRRCPDWVRMKPYDCTDMKLVDIEGDDKRGARRLVCRDASGPVFLTAGFASEKLMIWANRDLFLGNAGVPAVLVEVAHCGRTALGKPRHARFSKLRQDKLPPAEGGL